MSNSVKVYNSDGVYADSFQKPKVYPVHLGPEKPGQKEGVVLHSWNHMVWYLNQCKFWIKGQRTDKGVKI